MTGDKRQASTQSEEKYIHKWATTIVAISIIITGLYATQELGKTVELDDKALANTNSYGAQAKTIGSETSFPEASENNIDIDGTIDGSVNNVTTGDNSPVTINNGTGGQLPHMEGVESNVVAEDELRKKAASNGFCGWVNPVWFSVPKDCNHCVYFKSDQGLRRAYPDDWIFADAVVFYLDEDEEISWPLGNKPANLTGVSQSTPTPTPISTPITTPAATLTHQEQSEAMVSGLQIASMVFDQGNVLTVSAPIKINVSVLPASADTTVIRYSSGNPAIFSVDSKTGLVSPKMRGKATLFAITTDGRLKASIELYIGRNIVLLVGEGEDSAIQANLDAVGTVFGQSKPKKVPYEVLTLLNEGQQTLREKIEESLSGDVTKLDTIVFYFSGHGAGDMDGNDQGEDKKGWLVFNDGTLLSPSDLHSLLGNYDCRRIIILGSSYSGVFYDALKGYKYKILTACKSSESGGIVEQYSILGYGLFERLLCETGGWDMNQAKTIKCKGDSNGSGELNLREIYVHIRDNIGRLRRSEIPNVVDTKQTVQSTEGDRNSFTLFQLP